MLLTGGTENLALEVSRRVKRAPIMLVTSNIYNSFPAGLELLPALREEGHYVKLIYSKDWKEKHKIEIDNFEKVSRAIIKLKKLRVGLIGGPSNWLVSSIPNRINKNIKLNLVKVDLNELYKRYRKYGNIEQVEKNGEIKKQAKKGAEVSNKDLNLAYKMHLALDELMDDLKMDYVSVKCFDIIRDLKTTLCLSCFITNSKERIVGCEGDIPSLITMIAMSSLANAPTWMSNPIKVNLRDNTLTLAHCTISRKLTSKHGLRSHFESNLGVGINGVLKHNMKVTLSRIGKDLNEAILLTGKIIDSDFKDEEVCRTKAVIELDQNLSEFMDRSIGNHIIMLPGSYMEQLAELYNFFKIKIVCCKAVKN